MKISHLHSIATRPVSHNAKIQKRVMIEAGTELPNLVQFAQAIFPPGEKAPAHRHEDMTEVFFVESGEGEMSVDETLFHLVPGSCVVVEAGEEHEIRNSGEQELVITYFGLLGK